MRDNYQKWGQVISFDLTFNLVRDVHSSGSKWKMGCFVALTSSRRVVPVALVATLHTTKEVYVQILRTFFSVTGTKPPVLVTDEETGMLAAIDELK